MQDNVMIEVKDLKKQYRLGTIGGTTLSAELQSWWARVRGKEDPNLRIGIDGSNYGEKFWALNGVNFSVEKGEAVGIIGHNGAGKSTLLKLLARVTAPTEGEIQMRGRITSMLEVGTGFHQELTGRENIYMNGAILGMSKKEVDNKIDEIIEFSECGAFIDTPVKRYSSGMYVKLAFAVAAHLDAEIMIMDEVLAVGDARFQEKCLGKMSDAASNEGKTILYVSHNMNTIRQLCDRVIVLDHGTVIYDGDVEQGISLYMGNQIRSEQMIDLSSMTRQESFINHSITMSRLMIENSVDATLPYGSKLIGRITVECDKDYEQIMFNAAIRSVGGPSVTAIRTAPTLMLHKGSNELQFIMDVSCIVPGVYSLNPHFSQLNSFGSRTVLDALQEVYVFEITATEEFQKTGSWETVWCGYYKAPEMECIVE